MKKWSIILVLTIVCSLQAKSFTDKSPIKWGKVDKTEFDLLPPTKDVNPPALVLCDFGQVEISNRTFYKRHIRIRILNEDGLKYAKVEIPYSTLKDHDDFLELKAETFNLEDGKIIRTKLKSKDIKDEKIYGDQRKKVFVLPDVKPGSIIEYTYTIASLDLAKLKNWDFQREIPVVWSEIRMDFPRPFTYLVTFQRGEPLNQSEQNDFAKRLEWLYSTKEMKARTDLAGNNNILYESPGNNYRVYVINNMKKKIVMKNLPGISSRPGYISINEYYPKVRFQLFEASGNLPPSFRPLLYTTVNDYETKSRYDAYRSNELSGYVLYRLETYPEMTQDLLESKRFGLQLQRQIDYFPVFNQIISNSMTNKQKMIAIYDYVRNNFKWNGHYSMYLDRDLSEVFREKEGSSGEINMILTYLLRKAGLNADPVLIRTNNLGMPEMVYPVQNQFNHVISMITVDSEMYLLDATDPSRPYNIIAQKDLYTQGWLVDKDNYGWIDLSPNTKSDEINTPVEEKDTGLNL